MKFSPIIARIDIYKQWNRKRMKFAMIWDYSGYVESFYVKDKTAYNFKDDNVHLVNEIHDLKREMKDALNESKERGQKMANDIADLRKLYWDTRESIYQHDEENVKG